ncbi:hypothetical protein R1flu_002732 [Riccia fluitans]|uniref:Protein kinase domain-containing protein n=1 Tax=Riccia fluitans TaxID=41844 RepID=A0ABD1Y6Y6_9MARC
MSSRGRGGAGGRGNAPLSEIREETHDPTASADQQAAGADDKKKGKIKIDIADMDAALYKIHGKFSQAPAEEDKAQLNQINPSWEIDPSKLALKMKLGEGSFGTVHRATYDGQDVAVKIFNWDEGSISPGEALFHKRKFLREVEIISQLNHPNVTRFVGYWAGGADHQIPSSDMGRQGFYSLKSGTHMLLMEFIAGGSLRSLWISARRAGRCRLGYSAVMQLALDTARGLAYLHSKKICHRDLKPDNLLLDNDMRVKIADFGESRVQAASDLDMSKRTGTAGYMAPEVLAGTATTGYNHKCDVFSFGMVVYELFVCDIPYNEMKRQMSLRDMAHVMCERGMRPTIPKWCPKFLKNLMKSCWSSNPAERPEMADVVRMIESEPVTTCGLKVEEACDKCDMFCTDFMHLNEI